jgi:hypothetical protein
MSCKKSVLLIPILLLSNVNFFGLKFLATHDGSLGNVTAEYDMQLEGGSEGDYDPNASLEFGGGGAQMDGQDDEIFDIQQAEIIFN